VKYIFEGGAMLTALKNIKTMIETAIVEEGYEGKNRLIRSQKPIKIIHEEVKKEIINYGINPDRIKPALTKSAGELKIYGFFKAKDQDVAIIPSGINPQEEFLREGLLTGKKCPFGADYTERIISINVRSQLSSLAKNFDTLYERTFAETLNLHMRCKKMILGEVYMIPVFEYDSDACKQHKIIFKENKKVKEHIEKYIRSFQAINMRTDVNGEEYKYERVCLLIVDFSKNQPVLYNSTQQLIADGFLDQDTDVSMDHLTIEDFVHDLVEAYKKRGL